MVPESYISMIKHSFNRLQREFRSTGCCSNENGPNLQSFENSSKPFGTRYDSLKLFCAELVTVFPGTSTVEEDFPLLGQEETRQRSNISKLTIAGKLSFRH